MIKLWYHAKGLVTRDVFLSYECHIHLVWKLWPIFFKSRWTSRPRSQVKKLWCHVKSLVTMFAFFRADLKPRLPPWHPSDLRHFWLLPCNRWTEFNEIWQKARTNCPISARFVFFMPIEKQRWPPKPVIGWDFYYFSAATSERNLTKSERKQLLNII